MVSEVWSDPNIKKMINENFILAELYVDDYDLKLPEAEQYVSVSTGKKITTVGRMNTDFQISKFNSNSQPLYAILDNKEELLIPTSGANYNIESYRAYLQSAIDAFHGK